MTTQEAQVPIDVRLRFVLFGLECIFGIETSGRELNRVFRESLDDQVHARNYLFFEGRDLVISGTVDAYEPESIRVKVMTSGREPFNLPAIRENAEAHFLLIRSFECDV